MGEGTGMFFDLIAVMFLALTVIVLVMIFGIATDTMDPPILAPATAAPLPPTLSFPTYTPSPGPGAETQPSDADMTLTPPVETPAPDAQ
jgi:hypothetical protein